MRAPVLPKQDGAPAQRLHEAVESSRRQIKQLPWTNGRLLEDIEISAASTITVHHGLGHQPKGYFVTDLNGIDGRVSRLAWSTTTIQLFNSSAAGMTISVWVW